MPGVVTPLTASSLAAGLPHAMLRTFGRMGWKPPRDTPLLRQYSGRFYFNLAALQWIGWHGWGSPAADTNRSMGGNQPEIALPDPRSVPLITRLAWARRGPVALVRVTAALRRGPSLYRRMEAELAHLARADLPALSDLDLLDDLFDQRAMLEAFFPDFMTVSSAGSAFLSLVERLLRRWLGEAGADHAAALVAGHGSITSAEHGYRLRELAEGARREPQAAGYLRALQADPERSAADWRPALAGTETGAVLDRFLAEYGHRAVVEWELANPRWREKPDYLLRTAAGFLDAPPAAPAGEAPDPDRARKALRAALRRRSTLFGSLQAALLFSLSRRYGHAARLREQGKSVAVKVNGRARDVSLEVGRRMVERGCLDRAQQVFYLEREELSGYLLGEVRPETLRPLALRREEQFRRWQDEEPPGVFSGDEPPELRERLPAPAEENARREWQGLAVSGGRAAGRARILLSPAEGHRLQAGEILVAPFTDPAWTPLFLRAAALVLEIGGYLSHGAIVAREYGLPAVANLPGITHALHDGDWLEVDGGKGTVRRSGVDQSCSSSSSSSSSIRIRTTPEDDDEDEDEHDS
jgi:pyruvate,water dikinase